LGGPPGARGPMSAVAKLMLLFGKADEDHSGFIDGSELEPLSKLLRDRFNLTKARYQEFYSQAGRSTDGKIDFEEFKRFVSTLFLFQQADTDKDGLLAGAELGLAGFDFAKETVLAQLTPQKYKQLLHEADSNSDGKLSPAELKNLLTAAWESSLPPFMAQLFAQVDKDKSGFLEGAELEELAKKLEQRFRLPEDEYQQIFADAVGKGSSQSKLDKRAFKRVFVAASSHAPYRELPPLMLRFFNAMDKDKDGVLKAGEITKVTEGLKQHQWISAHRLQQLLQAADSDKDGELLPDEFKELVLSARKESPFVKAPLLAVPCKNADKNHDQVLSQSELASLTDNLKKRFGTTDEAFAKALAAADANKDGKLVPQELGSFFATLGPQRPRQQPRVTVAKGPAAVKVQQPSAAAATRAAAMDMLKPASSVDVY